MHIATKGSKIDISTEKKLEEFSKKISANLKAGDIFFLNGEMGVGKTTFVRYLINNLQLKLKKKLSEVTSPTFNIINEYNIDGLTIKHCDLYRLNSSDELRNLDLFSDRDQTILFIEWPIIFKERPDSVIELHFEYENDNKNKIIKI